MSAGYAAPSIEASRRSTSANMPLNQTVSEPYARIVAALGPELLTRMNTPDGVRLKEDLRVRWLPAVHGR